MEIHKLALALLCSSLGPLNNGLFFLKHQILMIDDDACLLQFTREFLENRGFKVDTASSGPEGVERVRLGGNRYSVVILDYQMPNQDGAAITRELLALAPNLKVLIYSGHGSRDAFLQPSRHGASGFVDKGEGPAVFLAELQKLCRQVERDNPPEKQSGKQTTRLQTARKLGMVGQSAQTASVAALIERLRHRSGPVLILGESGTGKELVARGLHNPKNGPFLPVNCADFLMSPGTARSELFGHSKGAFTGATSDHKGVFERAAEGTLFLDELHSLPVDAQWGLLRALQEKVAPRLGDGKLIPIRCRIVAASKPELERAISEKTFSPDLYYRISQNTLRVAPLRDRPQDIGPLVQHFCQRWSEQNQETKAFSKGAIEALSSYTWPGNIRELENTVFGLLNTHAEEIVREKDLPPTFRPEPALSGGLVADSSVPLRAYVESVERAYILEGAGQARSLKHAAHLLGVSPQNLIRLFKKHGIDSKRAIGSGNRKAPR